LRFGVGRDAESFGGAMQEAIGGFVWAMMGRGKVASRYPERALGM
jgi:hypothetical protein